ncbi:hypothetical protein Sango_1668600 [Sesamum angolense]|uniref:R13L1/DRL21-like LRR repeat region domain-containing protein n=1 Tax=Sesamum angolense TaxID=2727404 RepID=A0AAE1WL81_9LAMI|nr:hypothetical protein Sango_1668600 [Sesamum angolense]
MSSLAKQISVPIFSGQNYDYWAIKMKTYFQSQKLWELVEEGVTLPEDSSTSSSAEKGKLENKKAKDSEALYYIQTAVADHIFPRISVATSAKEAWSILQKEYEGSAKVRIIKLQTLTRDFENMKMKDYETIDEYYTKVRELVNQLKAYGEDIPEKRVVEKLLISVTEKYDPIVITIEETKDITTLTVNELVGSLEAYEKRRSIEKLTGLGTLSQFNYAERDWSKLGYLKELDQLSGSLELHIRLHDRQDVDEARKARLINKIHIEDMSFFFVRDAMGRSEEGELVRNEALEALQPPPKLKYLMIFGFRGTRFPSWISPSCHSHLRRLNIEECNYISTLPCLGKLPELVELAVGGMRELKFVGREFLGIEGDIKSWSGICFPMLTHLSFRGCPQWEEWEDIMADDEEEEEGRSTTMKIMPCLMALTITECGLTVLPHWLLRRPSLWSYIPGIETQ